MVVVGRILLEQYENMKVMGVDVCWYLYCFEQVCITRISLFFMISTTYEVTRVLNTI